MKRKRRSKALEQTAARQKASLPASARKRKAPRRDASGPSDNRTLAEPLDQPPPLAPELDLAAGSALGRLIALLGETLPLAPSEIPRQPSASTSAPAESATPQALHKEMRWRIAALEIGITRLPRRRRDIDEGGSDPATSIESFSEADRRAVENAITVLKAQPPEPTGPPVEALEAAQLLREIGTRIKNAAPPEAARGKPADTFVSERGKSAGPESDKTIVKSPFELADRMSGLAGAAIQWMNSLYSAP